MNRKRVFTIVVTVGVIVLLAVLVNSMRDMRVDAGFATEARLRFDYTGKPIDVTITDARDLAALKRILTGWCTWGDGCQACSRDPNVSITLSDGRKSITYYPARDTCEVFLVGSHKCLEVTGKQRAEFEAIVKKYGMTFPCV